VRSLAGVFLISQPMPIGMHPLIYSWSTANHSPMAARAASLLVASLLTHINAERAKGAAHAIGYLTPVLYQPSGRNGTKIGAIGCTDVLSGENATDKIGGYMASSGYDAVSGWGTPNGVKLASALPMQA
jgi:hypothetical protein